MPMTLDRETTDAEEVRERLAVALDRPESAAQARRLAKVGTTVSFVIDDEPVTVLFDRRPPALAPRGEFGEIVFELDAERAHEFIRGELVLANAVLAGEVPARGPVRRYLAKDPILRALLAEER